MPKKAPAPTDKKHHLISDDLRKKILSGKLKDQIPGQLSLAEDYDVNFLTVRKAISTLVKEGFLTKQPGRGTFVTRLKRQRTYNIAAILGGLSYGHGGQYSGFVHSIQEEAVKYNNDLIFRPHHGDPELEKRAIEDMIKSEKVDGILIWPTRNQDSKAIEILKKHKLPFVVVMRVDAEHKDSVSYVVTDDLHGGYLATKHLLDLGHKNVGYVARRKEPGTGDYFEELRWQGFLKAHQEAGLESGPRIGAEWLGERHIDTKSVSKKFIKEIGGLTGLFCVNDRTALHLMGVSKVTGLQIPGDISLVGYDNLEASELLNLTSVNHPTNDMARQAVQLLIEEIEETRPTQGHQSLSPTLVIRGTTSAPRKK